MLERNRHSLKGVNKREILLHESFQEATKTWLKVRSVYLPTVVTETEEESDPWYFVARKLVDNFTAVQENEVWSERSCQTHL
jgi:hypothetical protein